MENIEGEEKVPPTPEEEAQNIDFKKELETLEGKPKRSEEEKAVFTFTSVAKRLKELGKDPAEILGVKEEKAPEYVTKADLARIEARQVAQSDDELKVIMWWVENKGLSVEEAHWQANRGKLSQTLKEVQLAKDNKPSAPSGAGQKPPVNNIPELPKEEQSMLRRRGLTWNPKTNRYEGKFTTLSFDQASSKWVSGKK